MNRLQSELHRLYLCRSGSADGAMPSGLVDPAGRVRALVLELTRPADWDLLGKVWRGVQTELELPAPGIAVSGTDGLQLWFSVGEPVSVARAHDFLESLRLRFLGDVAPERIRLVPTATAFATAPERQLLMIPAVHEPTGNWSAFVAPDLAPIFAETPWLDIPPGEDGQAALLRALSSMTPAAFDAALARLQAACQPTPAATDDGPSDAPPVPRADAVPSAASEDAKRFLLQVMNDPTVTLALRVEAAGTLLRSRSCDPPR